MFEKVLYQMRKSRGESVIKRKIERVGYFIYKERERERHVFVSQMEKENIVSECVVVNVRMLSRCQLERERERES